MDVMLYDFEVSFLDAMPYLNNGMHQVEDMITINAEKECRKRQVSSVFFLFGFQNIRHIHLHIV
jgi:hypothetical protein